MIVKIIVGIVIICSCTYIGNSLGNSYRNKVRFFNDLVLLCTFLSSNIIFKKAKLKDILLADGFTSGKDLKKLLLCYVKTFNFDSTSINDIFEKSDISFLGDDDIDMVIGFLSCLGKSDSVTQIDSINTYRELFTQKTIVAKQELAKTGLLYQKLGVFVGLLIAILLV